VATDDGPGGGGSPMTKKIGGMPAWVVYVGGGLAIGIVYVIWKGRKAPTDQTKGQQLPASGAPQRDNPLILPIDQGLTDQQVGDLVAAITSLQGKASRPPRGPHQPPPNTDGGKDWMQQEAELLAQQTGESIAQIIWELQGKPPWEGPNPNEDSPLPNEQLYGSWAGLPLGSWADQYTNGASGGGNGNGGGGGGRGGWGQDQQHGGRGRQGDWGQYQGSGGGHGRGRRGQ
jgi:hypothetical protein